MSAVNYFQFIYSTYDVINENKRLLRRTPRQQEDAYVAFLYIKHIKETSNMTNTVTSAGAETIKL